VVVVVVVVVVVGGAAVVVVVVRCDDGHQARAPASGRDCEVCRGRVHGIFLTYLDTSTFVPLFECMGTS
jgi:hypothetical protein